jgi:hypothetical protein
MIKTHFKFDRATKNTYRYAEVDRIQAIGVLYVQKSVLGPNPPESLDVTIEPKGGAEDVLAGV